MYVSGRLLQNYCTLYLLNKQSFILKMGNKTSFPKNTKSVFLQILAYLCRKMISFLDFYFLFIHDYKANKKIFPKFINVNRECKPFRSAGLSLHQKRYMLILYRNWWDSDMNRIYLNINNRSRYFKEFLEKWIHTSIILHEKSTSSVR